MPQQQAQVEQPQQEQALVVRTVRVTTADGQAHVFEYETGVKHDTDKALMKEIQRDLVEVPRYVLQTLPNGTTATFDSEITDAHFLGPEEA